MLKKEIEEKLKELGIEFTASQTKAKLEELLKGAVIPSGKEPIKEEELKPEKVSKDSAEESKDSKDEGVNGDDGVKKKDSKDFVDEDVSITVNQDVKKKEEDYEKSQGKVSLQGNLPGHQTKEELLAEARRITFKKKGRVLITRKKKGVFLQEEEEVKNPLIVLKLSKLNNKPLQLKIKAVGRKKLGDDTILCARGTYGKGKNSYNIFIPQMEFFNMEEKPFSNYVIKKDDSKEERNIKKGQLRFRLEDRIGSIVNFIPLTEISTDMKEVIGSRIRAVDILRDKYWWAMESVTDSNKDGDFLFKKGKKIEGRVVTVIDKGVIFEVYGQESFIPRSELSYEQIIPSELYTVGQTENLYIKKIKRSFGNSVVPRKVDVMFGVKGIKEDTRSAAINNISEGDIMLGVVAYVQIDDKRDDEGRLISQSGVFVQLDGFQAKCRFPYYSVEPGDRVKIRIVKKDISRKFVWAEIKKIV